MPKHPPGTLTRLTEQPCVFRPLPVSQWILPAAGGLISKVSYPSLASCFLVTPAPLNLHLARRPLGALHERQGKQGYWVPPCYRIRKAWPKGPNGSSIYPLRGPEATLTPVTHPVTLTPESSLSRPSQTHHTDSKRDCAPQGSQPLRPSCKPTRKPPKEVQP